jgi:hypothetical protein
MTIPGSIGGPKIVGSNITGVRSIGFNGQTGSSQSVEITNPNPQKLKWGTTITYTPGEPRGWLQASPNTGSLDAHATSGPINVIVNKANLAPGRTYTANVVFRWDSSSVPGDTLTITFTA